MTDETEKLGLHAFQTDRPGICNGLGNLEATIKELEWKHAANQEMMVRNGFEILSECRRIASTRVMKTMDCLAKKGLLRVEKNEHTSIYNLNFTHQGWISRLVGPVCKDLLLSFSREPLAAITALAASGTPKYFCHWLDDLTGPQKKEEG